MPCNKRAAVPSIAKPPQPVFGNEELHFADRFFK
jgi:hypothetical protein